MKNIIAFGVIGLVFIVLKLINIINWSWWIVLAPFWVPFVALAVLIIIFAVMDAI